MSKVKPENRGGSRAITSREYKLILNPSKFTDKEDAQKLWLKIKQLAKIIDQY